MLIKNNDIIEVKNLSKKYGDKLAVNNINFEVRQGEIFGILGPNGAGKTSALEMMETLRSISSGTITIDGINVTKQPNKIKQIIGVQLQSSNFYDKITLQESLKLFASFYNRKIKPIDLLKKVDLESKAKAYPENLSGGQKQRFSIAVALVNQPKVLFLDEPSTGLDPQARHNLWELINKIKDGGITIVLTSHYMEEAEKLCDRVAIMDEGQIISLDTPANLISNLIKGGFRSKKTVEQANLEDVYINLTGKELRE
ncbi:MAG: ABC transporter ATP-binding protein [Bifidobacteriaceae bacterium]|jgi:ABC-2 type transport system ATP-binding protein|nr:ABC transporter ATP-binding protein [Bifidobacteriaceae bacterium]